MLWNLTPCMFLMVFIPQLRLLYHKQSLNIYLNIFDKNPSSINKNCNRTNVTKYCKLKHNKTF